MFDWINGANVAFLLIAIGFLGLVLRKELVIKLLALGIVNTGVVLFLVSLGYREASRAPIIETGKLIVNYVDPLPQAMVLAAIVINFAVLALSLVYVMILTSHYHTLESGEIERDAEREMEG